MNKAITNNWLEKVQRFPLSVSSTENKIEIDKVDNDQVTLENSGQKSGEPNYHCKPKKIWNCNY